MPPEPYKRLSAFLGKVHRSQSRISGSESYLSDLRVVFQASLSLTQNEMQRKKCFIMDVTVGQYML